MKSSGLIASVLVEAPLNMVWEKWITPGDIEQWNIPSDSWRCFNVFSDFTENGLFYYTMETKDGKERIENKSIYNQIIPYELIEYMLDDGRKSLVEFQQIDHNTIIRETFDPERKTPLNVQQDFCRLVLERFKKYVEAG